MSEFIRLTAKKQAYYELFCRLQKERAELLLRTAVRQGEIDLADAVLSQTPNKSLNAAHLAVRFLRCKADALEHMADYAGIRVWTEYRMYAAYERIFSEDVNE